MSPPFCFGAFLKSFAIVGNLTADNYCSFSKKEQKKNKCIYFCTTGVLKNQRISHINYVLLCLL
jgi:hypothetical protein